MHRVEDILDRQISDQPLDLAPAREMDVIAERAILLGARGGREPGFLAMQRDQRMGILDRGAIGKIGGWQVHRVPGPLLRTSSYPARSEEHTSELQSLMRISYAVFCLKKKTKQKTTN